MRDKIIEILDLIKINKFEEAQIKCDDIKIHFDKNVEFLHIYGFVFFNLKIFSFINDLDEKRFYSLQKEVSCPLCEGSSIAGSNAPIAFDIKNKIYE